VTNAQAQNSPGFVALDEPSLPGGAPTDVLTVEIVAQAWCAVQQGCSHIGPGRDYDGLASCLGEMRIRVTSYVEELNCPRGAGSARAHSCQSNIESLSCTQSIDTLASLDGCSKDSLCEP
jgi:hypothetical protein